MILGDSMEDKIMELLKLENKSYEMDEIYNLLNLKTVDDFKELIKTLNMLEDELKVYRTNKNRYMLFNNSNLKIGIMMATKKMPRIREMFFFFISLLPRFA